MEAPGTGLVIGGMKKEGWTRFEAIPPFSCSLSRSALQAGALAGAGCGRLA